MDKTIQRTAAVTKSASTLEAARELIAEWRALPDAAVLDGFEPREGHVYTVTRAISARINQNWDGFPSAELKAAYRTFLGKPVFVNHANEDPTKARGRVVAARYAEDRDDKYIAVIQEVNATRFPVLARELVTGGLDAVSMGCIAARTICSICGNEATDIWDMCGHVLHHKGTTIGGRLCYEECHGLGFFELSYVFDPADETAMLHRVLGARTAKGLPAQQKCKYCAEQATERVFHAEGMAYVPVCDRHEKKAVGAVGSEEVTGIEPIIGAQRLGPGRYKHFSPDYGTFVIEQRDFCDYPAGYTNAGPRWFVSNPDQHGFSVDPFWTKAEALLAVEEIMSNPQHWYLRSIAGRDLQAYGETESPERVDTLRDEEDDAEFHQYVESPPELADPDLEKNLEIDHPTDDEAENPRDEADDEGEDDESSSESIESEQSDTDDEEKKEAMTVETRRRTALHRRSPTPSARQAQVDWGQGKNGPVGYSGDNMSIYVEPDQYEGGWNFYILVDGYPYTQDRGYGSAEEAQRAGEAEAAEIGIYASVRTAQVTWYTVDDPLLGKGYSTFDPKQPPPAGPVGEVVVQNGGGIVWYVTDHYTGHDYANGVATSTEDAKRAAEEAIKAMTAARVPKTAARWERDEYEPQEVWRSGNSHVIFNEELGQWWGRIDNGLGNWRDLGPFPTKEHGQALIEVQPDFDAGRLAAIGGRGAGNGTVREQEQVNRRRSTGGRDMRTIRADQSRNDQGEQENAFVTQTPPAEGVVAPNEDDPISNSQGNLVAHRMACAAFSRFVTRLGGDLRTASVGDIRKWARAFAHGSDFEIEDLYPHLGRVLDAARHRAQTDEGPTGTEADDADKAATTARRRRSAGEVPPEFEKYKKTKGGGEKGDEDEDDEDKKKESRRRRRQAGEVPEQFKKKDDDEDSDDDNGESEKDDTDSDEDSDNESDNGDEDKKEGRRQAGLDEFYEELNNPSREPSAPDPIPEHTNPHYRDYEQSEKRRKSHRESVRRRTADDKLDVAAPDGRVDVEAPTTGTTDDEAQASQFDKGDFGDNAGDDIAAPDLSTDQNWPPGEGKKTGARPVLASAAQAVRLAEAYIAGGIAPEARKWDLVAQFENTTRSTVLDRIALAERLNEAHAAALRPRTTGATRGSVRSAIPRSLPQITAQAPRTAASDSDPENDALLFVR